MTPRAFALRLKDRCIWSWQGVSHCWVEQHSFRSWVWANAVSALLTILLPLTPGERAAILALGVLVLAAEAFNTAIELTVDYVSRDRHRIAGLAKDTASAGVFLTALAAGVAWIAALARLVFT